MSQILKYSSCLLLIVMLILGGWLYKENQSLTKELMDLSFQTPKADQIESLNCSVGKYPELPLIMLNLRENSQKKHYLRLRLAVELFSGAESAYVMEAPKLYDRFNVLLKEKDVSYFNQDNHALILKKELIGVSESVLGANVIKEILIQEVLVQ